MVINNNRNSLAGFSLTSAVPLWADLGIYCFILYEGDSFSNGTRHILVLVSDFGKLIKHNYSFLIQFSYLPFSHLTKKKKTFHYITNT